MRLERKKHSFNPLMLAIGLLLCVYVIGLFAPIIWTALVTVTEDDSFFQFYQMGEDPDFKFTLDNFIEAYPHILVAAETKQVAYDMLGLYLNSIKYAVINTVAFVLCTTIVSYLTARFDFKFSKIVYTFVIVAMSLPIVGSMPSEIRMLQRLGLYGSWWSMLALRFNFLSVYYLVLHATFKGISREYSEAAKIDGASNLRIMLRIIVPQAMNIIVTVFVITFITYWNDYQIPMLYLKDYPVAAYAVYQFVNTNLTTLNGSVPQQMAGVFMMTLPVLIAVIAFNKRLRVSVSIGGIKG